jgi:hypothetical protein
VKLPGVVADVVDGGVFSGGFVPEAVEDGAPPPVEPAEVGVGVAGLDGVELELLEELLDDPGSLSFTVLPTEELAAASLRAPPWDLAVSTTVFWALPTVLCTFGLPHSFEACCAIWSYRPRPALAPST